MLADGNRVTVWYSAEGASSAEPNLGVVLWSNHEGMQVRFDHAADPADTELWVDAKEDDWAWGDHPSPAALRPGAPLHRWIGACAAGFGAVQRYSDQLVWLGATLVIAPVSLLGQWADEIAQFAPRLRVVTFHSCAIKPKPGGLMSASLEQAVRGFAKADVVLTTSGMAAKLLGYRFHRIVVDEVHTDDVKNAFLFSLGRGLDTAGASTFRGNANGNYECCAGRVWLLTGTPLTRGVEDLHLGAHLLGHGDCGLRLRDRTIGPQLLAALKSLCIRHLKVQVIKGQAALSLPASETKIVWLAMTPTERRLYQLAAQKDDNQVPRIEREGAKDFSLEMVLRCRRQACSNIYKFSGQERAFTEEQAAPMYVKTQKPGCSFTFEWSPRLEACTKLRALLTDLRVLRNAEPGCMAVVFSCTVTYSAILHRRACVTSAPYRPPRRRSPRPFVCRLRLHHRLQLSLHPPTPRAQEHLAVPRLGRRTRRRSIA